MKKLTSSNKTVRIFTTLVLLGLIILSSASCNDNSTNSTSDYSPSDDAVPEKNAIQPYSDNPNYWQYKEEPIMLIGGSNNDNLFQWTGDKLTNHLDSLVAAGGNYLRLVMSDDDDHDLGEVYAFGQRSNGKYNLNTWNPEYWNRLINFLDKTSDRDIIVQLTLWDGWDFGGDDGSDWSEHPYNPKNNTNYSTNNTRLPTTWKEPPWREDHPLFLTVPTLNNDIEVLKFQEAFISKLLSIALTYNNVLYNIENEASTPLEWSDYWAEFIHKEANATGKKIYVTSMRDNWDIRHQDHLHVLKNVNLYQFFDASQNTQMPRRHGEGAGHQIAYEHLLDLKTRIQQSGQRPVNIVKTYGAKNSSNGAPSDAGGLQSFWINIFGGVSAVRFHRPKQGLGISEIALKSIKSARMLSDSTDFFSMFPKPSLLGNRSQNEAYALANTGKQYAVYFTEGREITLDISAITADSIEVQWLNILTASWTDTELVFKSENTTGPIRKIADKLQDLLKISTSITLSPPDNGPWIALINPVNKDN
ncbi:DUF6298 domain-containing protein [Fodinibius saliphilus]|uniref:DUF6298 domain-containing protein n=1 Tax=Fodinibius saliphilus TaxID=1920650 RepID=UPI0011099959|nr:DUF6298 domain-containing protein [Fodinibius saliphilus]